jgi:hypothetical protein
MLELLRFLMRGIRCLATKSESREDVNEECDDYRRLTDDDLGTATSKKWAKPIGKGRFMSVVNVRSSCVL